MIVLVGAIYIDHLLSIPHYPLEDAKLRATNYEIRVGGNVVNSAHVLSQSSDVTVLAVLPKKSSQAAQIIESAMSASVKLAELYRDECEQAACSFIWQTGQTRTLVNYNNLPEMTHQEFKLLLPEQFTHIHFEGRNPTTTLTNLQYICSMQARPTISVEIEKPDRLGLEGLAALSDVVFYSRLWAQHRGYNSASQTVIGEAARSDHSQVLVCTWGELGASALQTSSGQLFEQAAILPVDKEVLDNVGAGDTFIAAFLAFKHHDLQQRLQFACTVAGRKITQRGFHNLL